MEGPRTANVERVQLSYDIDFFDGQRVVTQPFVVAVLADLHGEAAAEERELPPLSERKFCAIDQDNRDQRIKLMRPMIYVEGEESPLQFSSLDDFDPLGIAQLHQGCRVLLAQRTAL